MGEQAIKWYGDNCAVYPLKDVPRKPESMPFLVDFREAAPGDMGVTLPE
jgi:hypothetical protein